VVFVSSANNLTTNVNSGNEQIFARSLALQTNLLVSVNTNGMAGNNFSDVFSISTNGTKIAFRSYASDLVAGDNNNTFDVFYRDLSANNVVLVSANSLGTGSANGYSDFPHVSADGNYVAFGSYASNLSPADNNTRLDIYRRNIAGATNELVSANTNGVAGNSSCGSDIYINGDGRYVAFESYDSDLTPGVPGYYQEIYLRDMTAGTNQLVSISNSNAPANNTSLLYGLSLDGRYVLFGSYANNLTANDSNNGINLYVRDVVAGTTTLVTVDVAGNAPGNDGYNNAVLSASGRFVLFGSVSTNLVAAATQPGVNDAFVRDMVAGTTTLLSTVFGGTTGGNGDASDLAVSTNGVAAFTSDASDLAPSDDNGTSDVFARAPGESSVELVSQGIGVTGDNSTTDQRVTADGTKIAFVSNAGNLVPNDTNESSDVFLYDLSSHTMTLISANAQNTGSGAGNSDSPRPSEDGHFVAYHNSGGANDQVYLRNAVSNLTTLVSVNRTNTAGGNGNSINPQITPSGQYVVFESTAGDLTSNSLNGATAEIFIRNPTNATCALVSVNGSSVGNGDSHSPSVSADGRYVAFESFANNFGPADSNSHFDVYVHDRQTGSNILCSPNLSGSNGGNDDSTEAIISSNGTTVVFFSYATDLVADDTNTTGNVFAFNLTTRTLQPVGVNTNGVVGNGSSFEQVISPDGRYVGFASTSSDLVPNDNNQSEDVFVRDLVAGTTRLVSITCNGSGSGNNYSENPQISGDDRYVTFDSPATDLVPGDFSLDSGSVFRRDLEAETTVLVSQSLTLRGEGNASSYGQQISEDGSVVSFLSYASDLIMGDANGTSDAFAWTTGVSGVDLAITMTPSAGSVPQGGTVSYTLTVTNYGLTNATSVVITDALPAALTFVSATTSQGTYNNSGGLFTCNLGTLNIGAGAQVIINATAPVAGLVTNSASTSAAQTDFNPGNNSASAVVLVTGGAPSPSLSFSVTNGNQLFLSWPYPSSGYNLETTTNLVPVSVWTPVTNTVSNNGLLNYVILNINFGEKARFFRLYGP
jgi:uncharacterized repeat protein (TIGR01451 family)